jgi:hypothetical protein
MSKSPLLLVWVSFLLVSSLVAVAPRPATAQTPLDSRHQLGLLNEVLADTVTQHSGTHPVKAPQLKLSLVAGALPVATGGDNMSVAVLDFDGDGDLDLVLGHSNGYPGFSSVLRNDGRGRFTPVADSGLPAYILVMARGDLDNDGRCDLVIATDPRSWYESQPSTLRTSHRGKTPDAGRYDLTAWRAVGDGRFEPWPVTGPPPGTAAAAAWDPRNRGIWMMPDLVDVDHDGRLDLVVSEMRAVPSLPDVVRSRHWLLLNRGDRLEATQVFGEPPVVDDAHGVAVAATFDVDGDGWTDLTCLPTSGFFALDVPVVWFRNRNGRFADIPDTLAIGHEPKSYAPCWYDVDSDGDFDLLALQTDAQGGRNDIYLDDGGGRWRRLGAAAGLWSAYTLMSAPIWADLDQDGLPDLVPCLSTANTAATRIPVRLNLGGGRFGTVTEAFTPACVAGLAASAAFDMDGDLDLDVVIAPRVLYAENGLPADHPAVIYRNDSRGGHAIMISLVGTRSNRSAIGARVEVQCGGMRQARIVGSGGLNGAINPPLEQHFGLGSAKAAERVIVKWPSGIVESWENLAAGRRWTLSEGSGTTVK